MFNIFRSFIAHPLIHMHQKKEIALEIVGKIVGNRTIEIVGKVQTGLCI
jgi:hypothetical protein